MNGAESLVQTLVQAGVEVCFTNPGTSEMHFVAALDEVEGMRSVLGLFEGVVSGAADGYARIAGKPAATLLHLGPGFSNAMANIHNARKGGVPMINIVGDHARYHLQYDAPLTADIEGMAATVSHWVHTSTDAAQIAADAARAAQVASHGQIATLVLPADVSWGDNPNGASAPLGLAEPPRVDPAKIEAAAAALRSGKPAMILVGGPHVSQEQAMKIASIGTATGARVCLETFPTRITRGAGSAVLERLPYLAEQAIDHIGDIEHLVLIGARAPVSFFAYPNVPSVIQKESCEVLPLAQPGNDIDHCIDALLGAVDAQDASPDRFSDELPELPTGQLNALSVAQSIARHMPRNTIIVDDGATSSICLYDATATAAPHDWLALTGGSIGFGLPCAVGAAIAAPERKVISLAGDGSAMYTIQALWTMARENLDICVIVFNNRKYNILELEFARTGARGGTPGPKAAAMLDIGSPDMDFAAMATGMGFEASRAPSVEAFNAQLSEAMANPGPRLIEVMVPPIKLG